MRGLAGKSPLGFVSTSSRICAALCANAGAICPRIDYLARVRSIALRVFSMLVSLIAPSAIAAATAHAGEDATGTWYLNAAGARLTLTLRCAAGGQCTGKIGDEKGRRVDAVEAAEFNAALGTLRFRRRASNGDVLYRGTIAAGVIAGRWMDQRPKSDAWPNPHLYANHFTGWRAESFDAALAPRVYDLLVDAPRDRGVKLHATLRLDAAVEAGRYRGTFKVYASAAKGPFDEGNQYEIDIQTWDGVSLVFTVPEPSWPRVYRATVEGRRISGTASDPDGGHRASFTGTRAEVLSHGLTPMSPERRAQWQANTRRALVRLMMAGSVTSFSQSVSVIARDVKRVPDGEVVWGRDDGDLKTQPQAYGLSELRFESRAPSTMGGAALVRAGHGFLAVPTTARPEHGYPAVVALNGHTGSARQLFDARHLRHWYGDSFARHGYVVLAVDVGHRPLADRRSLYTDTLEGDDPAGGNGPHPALHEFGMDSDWEEDGERVWDAMRAVDYLLSMPSVDSRRIVITGLSLGAEVTTFAAALDPRFAMAIAAGFSPDLNVLVHRGSHGCWQWSHADVREYLDTSDLHALIAPRPLLVETGKLDDIYSFMKEPFAGDKQVMNRSRSAWADAPERLIHYLHFEYHGYHIGGSNLPRLDARGVRRPVQTEPANRGAAVPPGSTPIDWQRDSTTTDTGLTVFDYIDRLIPAARGP